MRRRTVLTGGGATIVGLITGCTSNGDGGAEPGEEIVRFSVTNEDDVSRSIRIEIQEDGEVVASGQGELLPAGDQTDPFRYGFPGIGVAVTAVIQSDNASQSVQWDPADCSELQVDVRVVDGEPEIEETCQ